MRELTLTRDHTLVTFVIKHSEGKIISEIIDTYIPRKSPSSVPTAEKGSVKVELFKYTRYFIWKILLTNVILVVDHSIKDPTSRLIS